jgi:Protein of unknown function (DUF3445)
VIHTPYDGSSKPFQIGLQQLDPATWIEVDDHLELYLAEKRRLYREETANVLVAEQGTEAAQQEVLEMLVEHLPKHFPKIYQHTDSSILIHPPPPRHPGKGRDPALPHTPAFEIRLDPGLRRDDGIGGGDDGRKGLWPKLASLFKKTLSSCATRQMAGVWWRRPSVSHPLGTSTKNLRNLCMKSTSPSPVLGQAPATQD